MFHEDVFDCLSADIKGAISKKMIQDNVMVRAEDGGYLIPPMRILKKYIEQELEASILVTKRLSSPRVKAVKNESITKENNVKLKEELFPGMQEDFKKMKELTKTLKKQKVVVNKEVPREKEVPKHFMEQLDELSKIAKPQKIAYSKPQVENLGFRPKKIYDQHHQDMCFMDQLKMHQNHLLDVITVQKKENPQGDKPPSISTGREPLGYSSRLRNTKQQRENEDKAKAQSQPSPERDIIQSCEILKKNTSIPGGSIDNEDHEEEKVMIPKIYK
ncbi:hypothetical protein O181_059517 [Austropuccinia psidii MF-1]|uniref:Uncharacterized protein n=1 Tax=Austropuccinia psidii MF-1 TaxID=1389203 RepID=A0A9Q3EGU1_9BASI|nr:hypothetical protein [Austropuccinia psidii MF-1]